MKLYEIKAEHLKTIDSLDIEISAITSKKYSSQYEQPTADLTEWSLLKTNKTNHMHCNSPDMYLLRTLKVTLSFNSKNGGKPFVPTSDNLNKIQDLA